MGHLTGHQDPLLYTLFFEITFKGAKSIETEKANFGQKTVRRTAVEVTFVRYCKKDTLTSQEANR